MRAEGWHLARFPGAPRDSQRRNECQSQGRPPLPACVGRQGASVDDSAGAALHLHTVGHCELPGTGPPESAGSGGALATLRAE
jgi:hypothetical protein